MNIAPRFIMFRRKRNQFARLCRAVMESDFFDADWYMNVYPDVAASGMDPLEHYCRHGMHELRNPGPRFDSRAYAKEWQEDVRDSKLSPFEHFIEIGQAEGRQPVPVDMDRHVATTAGMHGVALPHRIRNAREFTKLVKKSGLFDAKWYRATYTDIDRAGIDPFAHFIKHGAEELRDPGPGFDSRFYAETYPEYRPVTVSPLEYYLNEGKAQGHKPIGPPLYERWIQRFDSLDTTDRTAIETHIRYLGIPSVTVVIVANEDSNKILSQIYESIACQLLDNWNAVVLAASEIPTLGPKGEVEGEVSGKRLLVLTDPRELKNHLTGEYVLLLDGAIVLREHALYMLVECARRSSSQLVYADHDFIDSAGKPTGPVFKPQFSKELLRHKNYIGPCVLFTRDLFLRLTATEACLPPNPLQALVSETALSAELRVGHVPAVLYHIAGSAPTPNKLGDTGPCVAPDPLPKISIIIPTRNQHSLLRQCIDSIQTKTLYPAELIEIIIMDNGSDSRETKIYLGQLSSLENIKVIREDSPFNFSRLNNVGASHAQGEIFLFLNNDTVVVDGEWLGVIASYCMLEDVGAVGCKLLYPDRTIQHGGTVIGIQGVGGHLLVGCEPDVDDYTRELSAVTGACLAVRRKVFEQVGKFDPVLQVAFNDVKLCLDIMKAGYRNIYISRPFLIHHESKSRGYDDTPAKVAKRTREAIYVKRRFGAIFQNDPYYSPNLSLQRPGDIAFPPRAIKPWRLQRDRSAPPTVLFLSATLEMGQGVAVVIQLQAEHLAAHGFRVIVGGPRGGRDMLYPSCERAILGDPASAAAYAIEHGVDCIVVHTPPYFAIVNWLGSYPRTIFFDHGEPNPEYFADVDVRTEARWEKRFSFPLASRVYAISKTIRDQSMELRSIVLRNGNSHLAIWNDEWQSQRQEIRERNGWTSKLVVLNVCRFAKEERNYKGVDKYIEVMTELPYLLPDWKDRVVFVLCGKAGAEDVDVMEKEGLTVFSNVSDEEVKSLYLAADVYMNFSKWEGYNLGIGQALAMGLPVIASDIEAHREFQISRTNDTAVAIEMLENLGKKLMNNDVPREALVFPWKEQLEALQAAVWEEYSNRHGEERSPAVSGEHVPSASSLMAKRIDDSVLT